MHVYICKISATGSRLYYCNNKRIARSQIPTHLLPDCPSQLPEIFVSKNITQELEIFPKITR